MNQEDKKRMQNEYREKRRKEFEASLPMSRELFQQLFDYLDEQSEENECSHHFDMTTSFLVAHHCSVGAVLEWLRENGAGCDCEVLCNVEERFQ